MSLPPASFPRELYGRWLVTGVGGVLFIVLVFGGLRHIFQDAAEVDDTAFRPAWHGESERTNNPLAQTLAWLAEHPLAKDAEDFRDAGAKHPWNQAEAEAILIKYNEHYRRLDDLLRTDRKTWLWPEGPAMAKFDAPVYNIKEVQQLGALLVIRSKAAPTPIKAIHHASEGMRFGRGLVAAEGTTIHTLVGAVICGQSLGAVKNAVTRSAARPQDLEAAYAMLKDEFLPAQDIAFALRVEHETVRNTLAKLTPDNSSGIPGTENLPRSLRMIKPNRAMLLSMTLNESLLTALDRGWNGDLATVQSSRTERLKRLRSDRLRMLSLGVGGLVVLMVNETTDVFVTNAIDHETRRVLAMAQIALRLHELTNGVLPISLGDSLSPVSGAHMRDPWSGQNLIWKKNMGLLYSVGKNGRDDGGVIDPAKPSLGADFGELYWWAVRGATPPTPD